MYVCICVHEYIHVYTYFIPGIEMDTYSEDRMQVRDWGWFGDKRAPLGRFRMREAAESHGEKRATLQRQAIQWYKRAAKQGETIAVTC